MHQIPVRLRDQLLDALLARCEHELLEFTVCDEQSFRGRCFKCDPAFRTDDGIPEVDGAADAVGARKRLDCFDDFDRSCNLPIERARPPALECDRVARRLARLKECVACEDPGPIGDAAGGGEGFLSADRHAPESAIDGICSAKGRHRQPPRAQILQLVRTLQGLIAHRCQNFQLRRQGAQRHLEAHLIVAGRRAAVGNHARAQRARHARDRLRLHYALRADAERIELSAPHVAHDEEAQDLLEVLSTGVDQMMLHRAQGACPLFERASRCRIDAARIHRYGNDGAAVTLADPRHEK